MSPNHGALSPYDECMKTAEFRGDSPVWARGTSALFAFSCSRSRSVLVGVPARCRGVLVCHGHWRSEGVARRRNSGIFLAVLACVVC